MSGLFRNILEIPTTNLLMGGAAIIGGIFFSSLIVSYFNYDKKAKYDPDMSISEEIKEEEYKREAREIKQQKVKYGQKWFDELEALEDRVLTSEELVGLREKTLRDNTPEGDVIMFYNSNTESFWYYSDNKNISNRTLDAMARNYSVTHNCKQVCINHRQEIAAVQKKICDMMIAQTLSKNTGKDNKDNKEETSFEDLFVKPKITAKKLVKQHRRVVVDRVNRFSYKGKLKDCELGCDNKNDTKDKKDDRSKMSFQEYKASLLKTKME